MFGDCFEAAAGRALRWSRYVTLGCVTLCRVTDAEGLVLPRFYSSFFFCFCLFLVFNSWAMEKGVRLSVYNPLSIVDYRTV